MQAKQVSWRYSEGKITTVFLERLRSQYWSKKYTSCKERVSWLTCSQNSVIYAIQNLLRPVCTTTHVSFKSSLSSNHPVCMPFLNTVLPSLSSKVTVRYTARVQVNCPCKVFFSYLDPPSSFLFTSSARCIVMRSASQASLLPCTSAYIHSPASRRSHMLPHPIRIAANSRSTFLLHKAQGLNPAVFCYNDIWACCSRAGVDLYNLTNTCSSNRFPFPSDTNCISSCSSTPWYWNSNGLGRHYYAPVNFA